MPAISVTGFILTCLNAGDRIFIANFRERVKTNGMDRRNGSHLLEDTGWSLKTELALTHHITLIEKWIIISAELLSL